MKPAKGLLQLATWLMRLSVALFIFVACFHTIKTFDYKSIQFYVAVVFSLFGTLLFIGGFLNKPGITVFSGLMLFIACIYEIVILFSSHAKAEISVLIVIATVAFYFVTAGNKH